MIFVSHSSQDAALAGRLCTALERAGQRCWIAPRDIPPSRKWPDEITNAVQGCRVVLLVMTEAANQSEHVQSEIALAIEAKKPVVPYRRESVDLAPGFRFLLSNVQWFDAHDGSPEEH